MINEPLHIPEVQFKRIEICKKLGFTLAGWVEGEAVIKAANKYFRVMPDGKIELNVKQQQDKSLQLTDEYSGMRGMGYKIEKQSKEFKGRKCYNKEKLKKKIIRAV